MAIKTADEIQRETLEEMLVLVQDGKPDDPLALKVGDTINELWRGQPAEEWDRIAALYRKAFTLSEEALAARVGPPPAPRIDTRTLFTEVVKDGWFGKYLEYTNVSEAPPQFHFGSALAFIAAGLGRRPLIEWQARPTFPNVYVLLVGASGSRKGSAVAKAESIVRPAMGTNVLPTEGTHQGFAEALRRRYAEFGECDGLILAPEFKVLLSRDDRNKSDMVTWLTDWYDSPSRWERALRGEQEYVLEDVCISILGASNMAWLKRTPADAILGGFFPRFLIFEQPEHEKIWGMALPRFNDKLGVELMHELAPLVNNVPEAMGFDGTAEKWIERWYATDLRQQYARTLDDRVRKWLDRKLAAMLKMAVVWQLADGGPKDKIAVEWLERARAVCDWTDPSVASVYQSLGVTAEGEVTERVLRLIERNDGSATRRNIIRTLRNEFRSARVQESLRTLKDAGIIGMTVAPAGGTVYYLEE